MVFRLGYLGDIFRKTNRMSLSLQGKLIVLPMIKAFKQKLESLKTCIAAMSLTCSQCLDFSEGTGGDMNKCDLYDEMY